MTRKFIVLVLIITSLAAMGLIYGCSSGNKEGEDVTGTTPSAQGNIQSMITNVTISSPPVVTFTLFDENGAPLDPNTVLQGGGRVRFTIARIGNDGNYQNYIKAATPTLPGFDTGGTFATIGVGIYTYTFKTDIKNPGQTLNGLAFDPTLTHTVAAQIQRNITAVNGKGFQQAVNPYFNFRPDGQPVTVSREIVAISNCNECHANLGAHGGGRREIVLCILCHNKGVIDPDTGNPIDFKLMIHKIHMGDTLPSNATGGDFTVSSSDFGDVTYPFISGDDFISGTPAKCVKCHRKGKDLTGRDFGKDIDRYKEAPTRENCTTCHDLTTFDGSTTINIKNGANIITVPSVPHSGGPQPSDANCGLCHASTGPDYSISITGAHAVLEETSVFTGINFQILSVTNAVSGSAPTVTFKITDNSGNSIAPSTGSFNLKVGYPATDYTNNGMENYGQPLTQSLSAASSNGDGSYTITFSKPIPSGKTGVGVVGMEGRKDYTVTTGHKGTATFEVGGQAVQYYFDLSTGAQVTDPAQQRRRVVDVNKCINNCHSRLSIHGANRVNSIEECVICHNADATDKEQRPADPTTTPDGLAERPINFRVMIHKIHMGEDLSMKPYVIYGFGGSINDFSDVTYPRDKRDCLGCHIDATPPTFGLSLPPGALGTTISTGAIPNDDSDNVRVQPMTSVCTSCHDSDNTATHAADKTSGGQETCAVCHTSGLLLGPDFAHFGDHRFPPQ